jgi:hypothetical protein
LIDESIEQTKSQLIMLIRSQILHGERKDGSNVSEYMPSSKYYVKKKKRNGLFPFNTDPYWDMNLTGDFIEKIKIVVKKEFIEIQSDSINEGYLNFNLSEKGEENLDNVYELSPDRLGEYAHVHFYPIFMQKIRQKLDL